MYWCETCGGKNFKNEIQMRTHLKLIHKIQTVKNNEVANPTTLTKYTSKRLVYGDSIFKCKFCEREWRGKDTKNLYQFVKKHQRSHQKFLCDNKQFRSITSLLHYVDKQYQIHIGSVKGITKKRVFLDGIAK